MRCCGRSLDRLRPGLLRLFPGAEAVLDAESLALTHLRRVGVEERFEQLSVGTREQIAVLVRLALAQLLLEREGEAPCIVLDDALVYADEGRFEIMKTILQQAARDLQIVVLTCRPRDYLGLEARHLRLERLPRMIGRHALAGGRGQAIVRHQNLRPAADDGWRVSRPS